MPARGRRSRARRVLGVIGAVVGTTVVFVTSAAAAAVIHLDVPATRRLVATQVTAILHKELAGDVVIERIGGLGLRGIDGVRVRVKDPTGVQVLFVDGARVRVRSLEAARSFLFGKGDIRVPVDSVSIDYVDASIDGDPSGELRLARAFAAKNPTPPEPEDPNARGVHVQAPSLGLKHAWIHGQAPGAPPLDSEIEDLVAHADVDSKTTQAAIESVDLVTRGLPRGVDPRGRLFAQLRMPSATGKDMGVEAAFEGVVAGVPTAAHARMDGQKIDAEVDGRDVGGQGVTSTFGEVAIRDDVTLHAEAHGELPRIAGKAHVAVGRGTIDVAANVDLSEGTKADATVAVRRLDVQSVVPSAPVSNVGLDTHANVAIAKSGAITGDFTIDTLPGTVAGEALPIVKVRGDFTADSAHASGRIIDPRATADFQASMNTVGTARVVEAQLRAAVPDLSRLPKVGASSKGHAVLTADAKMNLGSETFEARTHLVAGDVVYDVHKVHDARILGTANGSLDKPVIDVGVHAAGIESSGQKVAVADVRGRVVPGAVTSIENAHVDVVREGHTIGVTAARVAVGGPKIIVEGAVVQGLGEPIRGDFSRDANEIRVNVDAPSIDLTRAAALAGQPNAVRSGTLSLVGDVKLRRDGATGELHAIVHSLSAGQIEGAYLSVDTSFAEKSIGIEMKGEMADAGRFDLATSRIVLGGRPTELSSWTRAYGRARFDSTLDMAKIAALLPKDSLPLSELRGQLTVAGVIRRDSGDVPPELSIHAHTRGLVVAGKGREEPPHDATHGKVVSGLQPWRSEGVDASIDAKVDATSGYAEAGFHAVDRLGTVIALSAKSEIPYVEILANPSRAKVLMERAPISAKLIVPKRAVADLPAALGTRTVPGTIEAELDVRGTALEPRVDLVAHARGVRSPSLPVDMDSDADVTLAYDGEKADLLAKVRTEKRDVLTVSSHVDVKARDVVEAVPGRPVPWLGSARVELASFPMEVASALSDRRIRGRVTGQAVLEDLNRDAKLNAQIGLEGLKIGRATYKNGKIEVDARNGKLTAKARLDQTDGYADVRAKAGLAWGAALAPSLDPNAPVEAHLDAKGFRAAAIHPFVQETLNQLDGRIDANASLKMGALGKAPVLEGKVVYRDGTVQLAALGEEFRHARANISFEPGGVVKVDEVFLRGTSGHLTANAVIQTRGLGLASATANVNIPKREALDLSVDGQPIGEISGNIKVAATASEDGKKMDVKVDAQNMFVALPQKLKSGIQELAEKENIRVGTFRDPKTFVRLPLDKEDLEPPAEEQPIGMVTDIDINLGEITIAQGNQGRVVLGGKPHVRITNKTEVTGQIQVKSGKVDVQGKEFEIERGTITFQGEDAANPIVVLTAAWTALDNSKIYADFVGPVKTGKVTLRSEPPRPRNEILAMILFGTADGANAAPPPPGRSPSGTTQAATSLGGGYAAQGLTEAMDDLTGIQATARVDTSRSTNPAPEIELQIAKRISLAFSHVLGTPPLSDPDKNLAIVDWRFRRNWSLELTLGDRGKVQTDAVWQKRY